MDLKAILAILWGNKWIIIATTVITVAVVAVTTFLSTPIYSASTTLRVATASSGSVSYQDYMYADRLMNTYTKIATSRPIREELMTKLGLSARPTLNVTTIPNTELIRITVESPSPAVAQTAANTLAEILIEQSKELYAGGGKSPKEILSEQLAQAEAELNLTRQEYDSLVAQSPGDSERIDTANQAIKVKETTYTTLLEQYDAARLREALRENTITIVEPAVVPTSPTKPRVVLNIGLGLVLGLVGGIGLAFLFQNLDNRLYTSGQIEDAAELPLIGKIPPMRRMKLLESKKSDAYFKESVRRLRTKILAQKSNNSNGDPLKTLLVTSAVPSEGKSTIVNHLAKMMAQSGQKVIVVDCDMRIPKQHKLFGLPNKIGLSSVLNQQVHPDEAIQKSQYSNLRVMTSGKTPPNPAELLGSPQMKALIDYATQQYDFVILDTPAILAVTDATILAPEVDGVVLVCRRTVIHKDAVQEVCKQLASVDARTLGVVVNDAELNGSYYYYHGK